MSPTPRRLGRLAQALVLGALLALALLHLLAAGASASFHYQGY